MVYPLDQLKIIPEPALRQLAALDIHNTGDLLDWAATPHGRQRLARETGISSCELVWWAGIADLLRIRGIEPGYAELLVKSGAVGNVQQFLSTLGVQGADRKRHTERIAEGERVHARASALAERLRAFAARSSTDRQPPSDRELTEAVEDAAELRPRLVLAAPDDEGQEFRQHILAQARERRRTSSKRGIVYIGILVAFVVVASAVSLVVLNSGLGPISTNGDHLSILRDQLASTMLSYLLQSMAILVAMLLILLALLFTIHDLFNYVVNTQLLLWLFNASPYRALYRKATSLNLERQRRAGWWSSIVLVMIILGLLLYLYFTADQVAWTDEEAFQRYFRGLAFPVALGGILTGIVGCIPVLHFYLRELDVDLAVDDASVQRYLIFRLCKLAFVPIMVVFFAQFALPALLQAHAYIHRAHIVPRFRADILEIRAAITAIDLDDELNQERQERLLGYLDEMATDRLADYGLVVTSEDREMLDFAVPLALNAAVWVLFTDIALLFVLPYFVLGGWRRGLFYMIMLVAAFIVEDALQESAPTWFSLKPRSVSSYLFVAFAVFANALFFDWLFYTLAEKRKVCSGCHARLHTSDAYCSVCGLMQP
jgi:hypothetical protein